MGANFYTSPEQLVRDRSEYARKGIARGRSGIALSYDEGIAFVAENPSRALHKVGEIYDKIAFSAVGKYNEYENLRVAAVRYADQRGYAYDRSDVTGRGLANALAQTLGTIFLEHQKPYEVELVVAEVGDTPDQDQLYHLTYDGSVVDHDGYIAIGGQAEAIRAKLKETHSAGLSLAEVITIGVDGLAAGTAATNGGEATAPSATSLEVAVLDRTRPRRRFRRITGTALETFVPAAAVEA
jgi:proteasome alpha subunit